MVQLSEVRLGQGRHQAVAFRGEPDPDDPRVLRVGGAPDKAGRFRPVHQLDRAVVPQQQVAREVADGRRDVSGVSLDRDQELVLDVSEPRGPGLGLAPVLETAQADPERQQVLEVLTGRCRQGRPPGDRAATA